MFFALVVALTWSATETAIAQPLGIHSGTYCAGCLAGRGCPGDGSEAVQNCCQRDERRDGGACAADVRVKLDDAQLR